VVIGQVDVRGIKVPEDSEDELLALDEDIGEAIEVKDPKSETEAEQ
jgi:hypothetical protein